MIKEKQIEEIMRELREYGRTYDDDVMYGCDDLSEYLVVNKGYAKASDVASEIFEEIEKVAFTYYIDKETDKAYRAVELAFIAELKKKYTEREK